MGWVALAIIVTVMLTHLQDYLNLSDNKCCCWCCLWVWCQFHSSSVCFLFSSSLSTCQKEKQSIPVFYQDYMISIPHKNEIIFSIPFDYFFFWRMRSCIWRRSIRTARSRKRNKIRNRMLWSQFTLVRMSLMECVMFFCRILRNIHIFLSVTMWCIQRVQVNSNQVK